jgi:hypothetical protein
MANTTTHAPPAAVGLHEAALGAMADRLEAMRARLAHSLGPDDLAAVSAVIVELRGMSPNAPPAVPGHAPAPAQAHAAAKPDTAKHT